MNKNVLIPLFFITLFLTFASNAYDQPKGIEVRGNAALSVVADRFSLSVAIVERGISASKTKIIVDHKTNLVVNAAKKMGIDAADIRSARVSLYPIYQPSSVTVSGVEVNQTFANGQHGEVYMREPVNSRQQSNIQVFEVRRQITLNLKNIENYDRLLDQIVKIGVTNVSSLSMSVSNINTLYQRALSGAILNAKQKALKVAQQANVNLGKLIYLKEISHNTSARMQAMSMESSRAVMHSSQVGIQQVTAEVLVTFALAP